MTATPPWLIYAIDELNASVREKPGAAANPRIVMYDTFTTLKATSDEVPWCAAFACYCLEQAGLRSPRSAAARDFLPWGTSVNATEAQLGDVAVFERGPRFGHVAFFIAAVGLSVIVVGGNQGNAVSLASFPRSRLLAIRRPAP